jgi:hypothetical protein
MMKTTKARERLKTILGREFHNYIDTELAGDFAYKLVQALDSERKDVLLKATYDLIKTCDDSHYVLNVCSTTVFYDDAECDGYCLANDIANVLGLEELT